MRSIASYIKLVTLRVRGNERRIAAFGLVQPTSGLRMLIGRLDGGGASIQYNSFKYFNFLFINFVFCTKCMRRMFFTQFWSDIN